VFAFNDDRTASPIDNLFHQHVASLIGSPVGLPDVLVAKVPEDILNDIFEFESREVIQYRHAVYIWSISIVLSTVFGYKWVSDDRKYCR